MYLPHSESLFNKIKAPIKLKNVALMGCVFLFCFIGSCNSPESKIVEQYLDGTTKTEHLILKDQNEEKVVGIKEFYDTGQLKMESYFDAEGLKDGTWRYYFATGQLWSEHQYKSGKKHGTIKVYFDNGQLRYTGKYEQDEKIGTWQFFNAEGELVKSENLSS